MAVIKGGFEIVKRAMLKELMKRGDDGIMLTLPKNELVDLNARITMDRLIRAGIDPESLTSPDQVLNILENINNQIMKNAKVIPGTSNEGKAITEKLFGKKGEVVEFPQKRSFKEEIEAMKKSGDLVDEDNMVISEKITDREMFKNSNLNKKDSVTETVSYIKTLEPIPAMKEANLVIGRKGKYKNLTPEESKKILQDTEDHIFERDVVPDEFDPEYAKGGRAGFYTGGITDVEPSLDDIGHGSDSLMSRTRLMSPGAQATTSTGLNYLLAEDNDNLRIPFRGGGMDMGNAANQKQSAASANTSTNKTPSGGGGGDDGPSGPPSIINPPPKDNKIVEKLKAANSSKLSAYEKFMRHNDFVDNLKARRGENYHELGGLDFMARFQNINPSVAKMLASGYQNVFELGRAIADGPGGKTIGNALDTAKEEARLNAVGIDSFFDPNSQIYKQYTDMVPESGAVQMADGGRIGFSGGGGGRRAFLKLLASIGGLTAAAKTGILGLGEGTTKKAITETVKKSVGSGQPPPYFFKLVEKIRFMGDDTLASKDKAIAKKYKDYYMEEDFQGNIEITKKGEDLAGNKLEDVYMKYTVDDVALKNKKGFAKVDEYEEFTARPDMEGKMKDVEQGVPNEVVEEAGDIDAMTLKKADGGRIGFSGGNLAKLLAGKKITSSSGRFLEKIFGKGSLNEISRRDPEMHRGLLEVVEMFRNRDNAGLIEYMQNFLPHMSKKEIQAFIKGDAVDAAGQGKYGLGDMQGQLIRLGSGRDYKGKLEAMKKLDNAQKLDTLDVTEEMIRKPNASGGVATMLGE